MPDQNPHPRIPYLIEIIKQSQPQQPKEENLQKPYEQQTPSADLGSFADSYDTEFGWPSQFPRNPNSTR